MWLDGIIAKCEQIVVERLDAAAPEWLNTTAAALQQDKGSFKLGRFPRCLRLLTDHLRRWGPSVMEQAKQRL